MATLRPWQERQPCHWATPISKRMGVLLAASGCTSFLAPEFATYLDQAFDVLGPSGPANPRTSFVIPEKRMVRPDPGEDAEDGAESCVYLAGNSLGLMPRDTMTLLNEEMAAWGRRAVLGHTEHPFGRPWLTVDQLVTKELADIVGAKDEDEVACMGTLTANLHLLLTSFYKPTPRRHKIMYEAKAFPSDLYAFASQANIHDFSPDSLLPVSPREGEFSYRTEDILKVIEEQGDSIAVIVFGAVQYYSGELFDLEAITVAGHAKGCIVGFDLAHAIGNVPLELHAWNVDFAVWCSYKYLNAGPGAVAGIFVHQKWADRPRLQGWWGHDLPTRFAMPDTFKPMAGAKGFQLSNPTVFSVVALHASLRVIRAVSGGQVQPSWVALGQSKAVKVPLMHVLREKSIFLTLYLETCLRSLSEFLPVDRLSTSPSSSGPKFTIITPSEFYRRGAQLSLLFSPASSMPHIFNSLRRSGVIGDEREPGVIRLAPVPLYNTYEDVRECVVALREALRFERARVLGREPSPSAESRQVKDPLRLRPVQEQKEQEPATDEELEQNADVKEATRRILAKRQQLAAAAAEGEQEQGTTASATSTAATGDKSDATTGTETEQPK